MVCVGDGEEVRDDEDSDVAFTAANGAGEGAGLWLREL